MRQLIQDLGRLNTVIIITVVSILFSISITYVVVYSIQGNEDLVTALSIAIIIPLIVAPLTSWPLMGLLMKIDGLERQMRELATFDDLTGLLSRQAFFHDSNNYINFTNREQMSYSILAIDLDEFKNINDKFGHPAGDEVLRNFATIAKTALRKSDLIGRIGGEEFAIFLPNTSRDKAYECSERLHATIRNSIVNYDSSSINYTVSIGLVTSSAENMESIENILKKADKALYLAKTNGRNCTIVSNHNKENH